MDKLMKQILRFGVVGGTAFLIDYGFLFLFTEVFGIHYLISSALSFCISVIYNYILSIFWVFDIDPEKKKTTSTFVVFIVLSVIGLGINQVLMWVGTDLLGIFYMLTKIVVTGIVMVYNFITRKVFLERKIPEK